MSLSVYLLLLLFSLSFIISHSPNLVQSSDNSANGDGPNGYANNPKYLAMDSSNNVFFTDGNSIRVINGSGVLTLSGPNTFPVGAFNGLSGIAVDSMGNLIVADTLNNLIKKIDTNGRITSIGATGNVIVSQNASMVSTFATGFNQPLNVAFDSNSNLYVSDLGNNAVKKIYPNGTVVTLASLSKPYGMAVDASGNVYVCVNFATVYKITPAGSTTLFAGSGAQSYSDGTGSSATFNVPYSGSVDSNGNVYIADGGNHRIRKITPAGVVTTVAGSGAAASVDGQGTSASINNPQDVKIDSFGNLYVAEFGGCKVRKISPSGAVTTIAGSGTCASVDGQGTFANLFHPQGLTLDGKGNIYVNDQNNCKIKVINSSYYVSTFVGNACGWVNGNLSVAQLNNPLGLAIDPNTGNLFFAEWYNNAIRKIAISQKSVSYFSSPTGVAVDSAGNIFVADQMNHIIKFIDTTGVINFLAGSGTASYADGSGLFASFNSPYGITLDLYGNVIVADTGNNMIRNVTRSGLVTAIAGSGTAGWLDGQGTSSLLNSPMGVAVDGSNRVFITDSGNNVIRVINSTGYVNTLFFGRGSNIVLTAPQGIIVAPNGDLIIADTGNKRMRTVSASMLVGRI